VRARLAFRLLSLFMMILAGACGARTGLLPPTPFETTEGGVDAGEDSSAPPDAGVDTGTSPAPICTAGQSPRPIATIDYVAPVLAVDDDHAYFISAGGDAGTFASVPKRGGAVTELAAAPPPNVDQMLVDDTDLWALDYAYGLYRIPKTGGPAVSMSPPTGFGTAGMGQDAANVYYSDVANVWRVAKSDGTRTAVITATGTQDSFILNLRLVGGDLYWTQPDGNFYTAHADGTGLRRIAQVDTVGAAVEFVTDGTTAYVWSERFGPSFEIDSVPVAGGPLTFVAAYYGSQGYLEDDAVITPTMVYFTGGPEVDGGGTRGIYGLTRAGAAVSLVEATTTLVLEQDDACLYWLDDGRLFTVAK
jgi:hypothetical protein